MVAFRLCTVGGKNPDSGFIKAAMLSAAAGVVLHNMIDFAIFEGGILVTFWITIAVLPAVQYINNPQYMKIYRITLPAKIILCLIVFMVIFSYISNVFLPVKKSGNLTNQAFQSENPLKIFEKAKQADKLSPVSSELAGEFCLQRYYRSKQNQWLDIAGNNFMTAVKRNPADYKNYEKLSRVYELLGNYDKAADFTRLAIQRYPGIARLRYNLAVLSERLGNTDTALKQYQKAVEIEDAYRLQFRAMYPEMDIFSRLGEEKYKTAKKRIKNLKNP
jgi:tetratricopeptide (TPR) repeat protein